MPVICPKYYIDQFLVMYCLEKTITARVLLLVLPILKEIIIIFKGYCMSSRINCGMAKIHFYNTISDIKLHFIQEKPISAQHCAQCFPLSCL